MNQDDPSEEVQRSLRTIGLRAVHFQDFLMGRAWGLFYAVWAAVFSLAVFGSLFINALLGTIFVIVLLASGYFVSVTVVKRARKVSLFRRYISEELGRKGVSNVKLLFIIVLATYAMASIIVTIHFGELGKIVNYISIASFFALTFAGSFGSFFVSYISFGRVTLASVISAASLLAGETGNVVLQIYREAQLYSLLAWGIIIALWFVSAFLSCYKSVNDLGEMDGE